MFKWMRRLIGIVIVLFILLVIFIIFLSDELSGQFLKASSCRTANFEIVGSNIETNRFINHSLKWVAVLSVATGAFFLSSYFILAYKSSQIHQEQGKFTQHLIHSH